MYGVLTMVRLIDSPEDKVACSLSQCIKVGKIVVSPFVLSSVYAVPLCRIVKWVPQMFNRYFETLLSPTLISSLGFALTLASSLSIIEGICVTKRNNPCQCPETLHLSKYRRNVQIHRIQNELESSIESILSF
jgi:hypothetical protein